jgi:predicted glutamine amidotransferase
MTTRLFGMMISDPRLVRPFLTQHQDELRPPTELVCDGFGIGYYQDDRALISAHPRIEEESATYAGIVGDLTSDVVVVHGTLPPEMRVGVGQSFGGGYRAKSTHPFRYRNWMLAHTGEMKALHERAASLRAALPTYLANSLRSDSHSELFLMMFLAALGKVTRLDDPNAPARAIIDTLATLMAEYAPAGTGNSALMISNGRSLVGVSWGAPVSMLSQAKAPAPLIEDPAAAITGRRNESRPGHVADSFKAVAFVSSVTGAAALPAPYERLPDWSMAVVDRGFNVTIQPVV